MWGWNPHTGGTAPCTPHLTGMRTAILSNLLGNQTQDAVEIIKNNSLVQKGRSGQAESRREKRQISMVNSPSFSFSRIDQESMHASIC
jgi:hypothetical protein